MQQSELTAASDGAGSNPEIRERIKQVIVQALERDMDPAAIEGDHLIDELGINSVDALEILIWIENTFGITIADEDLSNRLVDSLDVLTEYVGSRLAPA